MRGRVGPVLIRIEQLGHRLGQSIEVLGRIQGFVLLLS